MSVGVKFGTVIKLDQESESYIRETSVKRKSVKKVRKKS